jgi:hypothetical protein
LSIASAGRSPAAVTPVIEPARLSRGAVLFLAEPFDEPQEKNLNRSDNKCVKWDYQADKPYPISINGLFFPILSLQNPDSALTMEAVLLAIP